MAKTAVKKNKKTITRIKPQNTKSNGSHIKGKSSPLSKEIDRVFNLQKENRWTIAKTSAEERIRKLKDIRREILKYQTELHEAFRKDFRKPEAEVDLTEILPVISEINDAIKNIKKWMRPKRVTTPIILFGATSEIHYEPKGIVLIIGPWNYPFHLMIAPLVASIAAGNCSILKPSELTPNVSKIVHKMLSEIFTENEVFVLNGGVAETTALLEKPFDHIFFTGSPAVGKIVMTAGAKNLSSVTLELGGKSPAIIDETSNVADSAGKIAWGKAVNAGQTCVAPDYLLIHESKFQEFKDEMRKEFHKYYGDSHEHWHQSPHLSRIINDRNFSRIKGYVDDAVRGGAKIEIGGHFRTEEKYISPTLISNVKLDSDIMKEEIFGPVLPVMTYNNINSVYDIIHSMEKPLALYIFSENKKNIREIIRNTSSGGAVINGVLVHLLNAHLPFGGVNNSGIGSYHGWFGFKDFSHERSVLKLSKLTKISMFFPPYTKLKGALGTFARKYLV